MVVTETSCYQGYFSLLCLISLERLPVDVHSVKIKKTIILTSSSLTYLPGSWTLPFSSILLNGFLIGILISQFFFIYLKFRMSFRWIKHWLMSSVFGCFLHISKLHPLIMQKNANKVIHLEFIQDVRWQFKDQVQC